MSPLLGEARNSRPPTSPLPLLAGLVLSLALAGCLADVDLGDQDIGDSDLDAADEYDRDLPADLAMEGVEVVHRADDRVTFRWTADAPQVAAGGTPAGDSATVETTFQVPADRYLRLNVTADLQGDPGVADWTLVLRDADDTVRCADTTCRIDPLQPVPEGQTWTLEARFDRNLAPEATLEAILSLAAVRPGLLHQVDRVEDFSAQAPDGTTLRGHVYVPNGTGSHPTILQYTPYVNGAGSSLGGGTGDRATEEGERTTLPSWMGRFLERGYAVAIVNLRGTGVSDGCNAWFDPHVDGPDAAAVIDALANASWSDGTVGMVGGSWHGYSQYAALLEQPEPLKAVTPVSSVLDLWSILTRHGAPFLAPSPAIYAQFTASTEAGPVTGPYHYDCPRYAEDVEAYNQLATVGDKTPYWERRQAYDILERNEIPALVTNGLDSTGEGHVLQVDGLWPLLNEESRLLVGPWPHMYPPATPGEGDWWDLAIRWMDHHLQGEGPAPDAGVVDYQDKQGEWHRDDVWPPTHTDARLHLSDGTLVRDGSQVEAGTQAFQAGDVGPKPNACTATKAVYVSPPAAEEALLAGNFQANLTVTSPVPDTNLVVYVWAVDEVPACPAPGSEAQVDAYDVEVSRALSDLYHRGHLEVGEPFPVGTPEVMSMRSDPFATRVEPGQRLVLAVAGGGGLLTPEDPDPVLQVTSGPDVEGWVNLPVVEGTLAFEAGGGAGSQTAPAPR